MSLILPFVIAFAISAALIPLCRTAAVRVGCVAQPKSDRWHRQATPLFGGVAIGLTVLACAPVLVGAEQIFVFLLCGAGIFVVGLVDDVMSLNASAKLVAQIGIASVFLLFGYRLGWAESLTLDMMLTLLWIVGITNAFNLLDNMDGLCGGLALIAGGAFLIGLLPAAASGQAMAEARYLAIMLGATAGFLLYNFHPASIFMGDSGSLFIGLNLAAVALSPAQELHSRSDLLSIVAGPVLVLLIPILDTTLVTLSRTLAGRSASTGGRDHSSHRLVSIGLSERAAVAVLWALAAMAGALGLSVRHAADSWASLLSSIFLLAMIIFTVYLARVRVYEDADEMVRRGKVTPLVVDFVYRRRAAEVLLDLCLVSIAYYAAYRLRFEGSRLTVNFQYFLKSLPIVMATQMAALFAMGAYRGVWRYFGLMDSVMLGKGVVIGCLAAQLIILYVYRFESFSRAVFVAYAAMLLPLLVGSRASFRLISEFVRRWRQAGSRLVLYGAGDAGQLLVRELSNSVERSYRILGFIDDDPEKRRLSIHGYRVLGSFDYLISLVGAREVDQVIISTASIQGERLRRLESACADRGVSLSRLQFMLQDLVSGSPQPLVFPGAGSRRAGS